jgi:hypothetical protein
MKRTYDDGYCDSGTFTSVIQDTVFQKRLKLVAIDEHTFVTFARKAVGAEAFGRQWVNYEAFVSSRGYTPFGTTATLTKSNWTDVRMSAGFDPQLQPIRTSVYRSDVFLCMLPTDNLTDIFKKILYTAMEESRDGGVPKMIFFVHDTLDTIDLRDDIVHWLRRWNKPSSIVSSFHVISIADAP